MNRFTLKKAAVLALVFVVTLASGNSHGLGALEGNVVKHLPLWLNLFAVAIRPDGSIYAVGSKARLLVSKDRGATWIERILQERAGDELFQDRDLYSIRFAPDGKSGWITGEKGIIFHTTDSGESWVLQNSGITANLFKLAVRDANTALAVGASGTIVRTTDGGTHWEKENSSRKVDWFDVTFTNSMTGWTVGELLTIAETTDGGRTWTTRYGKRGSGYQAGPLFSISFSDSRHGTASGLSGELMITSDGGKSWHAQTMPDSVASYVLAEDPVNRTLWAGCAGGRLFARGSDGRWREAFGGGLHDITDLAFSGNAGVAVGLGGTVLLTVDAGERWREAPLEWSPRKR